MGPVLSIHTGNRMEVLAAKMATLLRTPLPSPLEPEVIVVQSRGMQRWVSMAIARENGVMANCRFPFPRSFLDEIAAVVLPDHRTDPLDDPDCLAVAIHHVLPEILDRAVFFPIREYLKDDPDHLKRYQLSCRIADLFDQYTVFRSDMLAAWSAGRESHWQADLWRELASRAGGRPHRAQTVRRLIETLRTGQSEIAGLPARLCVFGISYLPPLYLDFFSALAARCPVHLFLMNPCREYWGDIFSTQEIARVMERTDHYQGDVEALHLDSGHPLLASMGGMGRVFIDQVLGVEAGFDEAFIAPAADTLLAHLQRDILTLDETRPTEPDADGAVDAIADGSLKVHSCHSPLREIEVLHDQLLALFETQPDVAPRDVMVMAPDIGEYAPYIHAVFDAPHDSRRRIRYTVSDEPLSSRSPMIRVFLKLTGCRHDRLGVTDIFDLLSCPAIRSRHGMTEADVGLAEKWVRDTRIRWGADEAAQQAMGLPGSGEHTWRDGIRRMLLGVAMPAMDGEGIIADILPYDAIEGADARVLGQFLNFLEAVIALPAELRTDRSLLEWVRFLNRLVERFFHSDDDAEGDLKILYQSIAHLGRLASGIQSDSRIGSRIVHEILTRQVAAERISGGFLSGGVSFCTLLPMRSIPAKAICLLGMNHDAFPRQNRSMSFDLMARSPRPGDRDRRKDDKYLFLETLVSARRVFIISFVGQSIIDNSVKPPSGLVSELLDHLRSAYAVDAADILTRHPLHAFSADYFSGSGGLFSYAVENCPGPPPLSDSPAGPFVDRPYPPPPDHFRRLDIDDLGRFFAHPVKYLLIARGGLVLDRLPERLTDREDHAIDGLTRFRMGQDLVHRMLDSDSPGDRQRYYRLSGQLPPGTPGDVMFDGIHGQAAAMAARIHEAVGGNAPSSHDVDLTVGDFRITGSLHHMAGGGRVVHHFAAPSPRLLIRQWVLHLIMNATAGHEMPLSTRLVTTTADIELMPVSGGDRLLNGLLDLYWQGLQQPLPLFPKTSYAYAYRRLRKKEDLHRARSAARSVWEGSAYAPGEGADPYLDVCFQQGDALNTAFERTAEAIFAPLFDHGGIL